MRRLAHVFVFLLILILFSCTQGKNKIKIGYLQITEDEVLNTAKKGIFKALEDSGFVDGDNIKIIDNNAQSDLSMIITILQSFRSQGVDLIITNGTPCMVAAAQSISKIPVVFTVSFGPKQIGLKNVSSNIYGVYDPLNAEKFVSIMLECLPQLKRVGLPYNNAEPNAEYSAKEFIVEFEKRGIEVIAASVTSVNDLVMTGQYFKGQKLDAMLVPADNTVYMGLNVLGKVAGESNIPLFVTEPLQVEKGASIGMGVNYEHWGYLGGQKAVELLKGRKVINRIEPIRENDLIINKKACNEQSFVVPETILEMATRVID